MNLNQMKEWAFKQGRADALEIQEKSPQMTGTELNAADDRIPRFRDAIKRKNMLDRKAGQQDGFVCLSTAGRVVRLIQNYNSDIYQEEPENLPAQYRFVWSTDPAKARPFIASSTSYYNTGDCCLNKAGEPRRSKIDANVFDPDTSPEFWEDPYAV
ncbi:MAG: hypothetical protein IIW56_06695 [Oscillospiraceae bacterium]|nr:hypothetical protein [Oscillospiraceae bacterium]